MNKYQFLNQLRMFAVLEGISYLSFGVTMPLKYMYDMAAPNYYIGMAHGVLFLLFCVWTVIVARQYQWKMDRTLVCLGSSLLPFATFIVDYKILKKEAVGQQID